MTRDYIPRYTKILSRQTSQKLSLILILAFIWYGEFAVQTSLSFTVDIHTVTTMLMGRLYTPWREESLEWGFMWNFVYSKYVLRRAFEQLESSKR